MTFVRACLSTLVIACPALSPGPASVPAPKPVPPRTTYRAGSARTPRGKSRWDRDGLLALRPANHGGLGAGRQYRRGRRDRHRDPRDPTGLGVRHQGDGAARREAHRRSQLGGTGNRRGLRWKSRRQLDLRDRRADAREARLRDPRCHARWHRVRRCDEGGLGDHAARQIDPDPRQRHAGAERSCGARWCAGGLRRSAT